VSAVGGGKKNGKSGEFWEDKWQIWGVLANICQK